MLSMTSLKQFRGLVFKYVILVVVEPCFLECWLIIITKQVRTSDYKLKTNDLPPHER